MIRIGRDGLERIPAYVPAALTGIDLDLRDNVNLWGAPPNALRAVQSAGAESLFTYPAVSAASLTELIASRLGVRDDEVVAGCGSDDLLDVCFRAVAAPGERLAHAEPSFSMVPRFARLNGLEPVGVPLLPDGAADVDGLLATGARIIYLCSPNNPTGTITPESEVKRLIANAPGIVVVDEAYGEFSSARDWRAESPAMERVLVLRTFSKAWGLAGLRVGYGVGSRTLIDAVIRSRGPYKVSALAELAATTALREDEAWMLSAAAEARENRARLDAAVQGRAGVRAWASQGNFVFWQLEGRKAQGAAPDSATIAARFAAHGIGVRGFSGLADIGEALRIGMAPWSMLRRVADLVPGIWP